MQPIWLALVAIALAACGEADFAGSTAESSPRQKPRRRDKPPAVDAREPAEADAAEAEVEDDSGVDLGAASTPPAGRPKPPKPDPEPTLDTAEDILELCRKGRHETIERRVEFAKVDRQNDPALSAQKISDSFYQAMRQTQAVELPEKTVLCGFGFAVDGMLKYDDEIFMALNGNLLFTSFDATAKLDKQAGLYRLEWERLRGIYYDGDVPKKTPPWCLWSATDPGNCKVGPKGSNSSDQNTGQFAFDPKLSPELSAELAHQVLADGKLELELLTVEEGDDCYHEAFTLVLTMTTVRLP